MPEERIDGRGDAIGDAVGPSESLMDRWDLMLAVAVAAFLVSLPFEPIWSAYTWPYLWGPVAADAAGHDVDGIRAGYTQISTMTYAFLMIAFLLLVQRLLAWKRIRIDRGFVMSAVPFVAFGAALRVLEDAHYYHRPLAFLFISPMVYALVAALLLLLLGAAELISRLPYLSQSGAMALVITAMGMFALAVGAGSRWTSPPLIAFTCALLAFTFSVTPAVRDRPTILFYSGLSLLLLSILPLTRFIQAGAWDGGEPVETSAWVVPAVVAIAAGATILVFAGWKFAVGHGWTSITPFAMPLFFAHLLDGTATAVGIEYFGMWEKHWLPSALIDATGNAWVMIPLKLLVMGVFVYAIKGPFRRDIEEDPDLYHIVYLAVLVLGLAPGMRDMFRTALGV